MRLSVAIAIVSVSLAGCEFLVGPTCGTARCRLHISTEKEIHNFEEPITFIVKLTSKSAFKARLFKDRLCGLSFNVNRGGADLVFGYRVCVSSKSDIPEGGFRDWGVNASKRITYKLSQTEREPVGPSNAFTFTFTGKASVDDTGLIFVSIAEDVYFTFRDNATVSIGLAYQRSRFFGSDDGRFGGYIRAESVIVGGEWKLRFQPVSLEIG